MGGPCSGAARLVRGLRRRQAERFGVDLTVMLGQDLAEAALPIRDGTAADLAMRDRKVSNGHGETVIAYKVKIA